MKLTILALLVTAGCFRDHPTSTAIDQTDCIACHQVDFTQSTQHMGQGSTACASCHDPNAVPAWAFAHPQDPFPTESGKHAPFSQQCHTCHDANRGNDYRANLDCYGGGACHTNSHHHDPSQPGRCFECHPTGRAGDGG